MMAETEDHTATNPAIEPSTNPGETGWHVFRGGVTRMDAILPYGDVSTIAYVNDKRWSDAIAAVPDVIQYLETLVLIMGQMPAPELGEINWPCLRDEGEVILGRMKGGAIAQGEVAG